MLVDKFDYFKTAGATTDTLTASTTDEVLSDARYYPPEGKYADGSGEKILEIIQVSNGSTAGTGHTFALKDCATEGGSYVSRIAQTLTRTVLVAYTGGTDVVLRLRLPLGLAKYLKVSITGTASTDNSSVFKARIVNG